MQYVVREPLESGRGRGRRGRRGRRPPPGVRFFVWLSMSGRVVGVFVFPRDRRGVSFFAVCSGPAFSSFFRSIQHTRAARSELSVSTPPSPPLHRALKYNDALTSGEDYPSKTDTMLASLLSSRLVHLVVVLLRLLLLGGVSGGLQRDEEGLNSGPRRVQAHFMDEAGRLAAVERLRKPGRGLPRETGPTHKAKG